MNQKYSINRKRNTIFLVFGFVFLTLAIYFKCVPLIGLGGAMVGVPLAHDRSFSEVLSRPFKTKYTRGVSKGAPYRSKAHHIFVAVSSLLVVFLYIFLMTYLFWGRIAVL